MDGIIRMALWVCGFGILLKLSDLWFLSLLLLYSFLTPPNLYLPLA